MFKLMFIFCYVEFNIYYVQINIHPFCLFSMILWGLLAYSCSKLASLKSELEVLVKIFSISETILSAYNFNLVYLSELHCGFKLTSSK